MPAGRPTIYNPTLAEDICNRIANGESLRAICNGPVRFDPMVDEDNHSHMPAVSTVLKWALDLDHEFHSQYEEARRCQMEYFGDTLRETGDQHVEVARSRLLADNTKWLMARLAPKRYGDRIQTEVTGRDGTELGAGVANQLASVMAAALAKRDSDEDEE